MSYAPAHRPLEGVTVVDLSRLLPGPLAAQILASLGARVIKVEEPKQGDPVRWAPPADGAGSSLGGMLLAGVESVALDLKKPAGVRTLLALLERADVLLDTLRPGTLERLLGCSREQLQEQFPRLVQCSVSGWGQDGPDATRSGHDLIYQARAGALAPTVEPSAVPVADLVGAWSAATAVLAALYRREGSSPGRQEGARAEAAADRQEGEDLAQQGELGEGRAPSSTGPGCRIDASLYDAALHANLTGWAAEAAGTQPVGRPLPLSGALPCYRVYRSADGGFVALALLEDHFWKRFCRAIGREDLARPHPSDSPQLARELELLIATENAEHWRRWMARHDLPGDVVLSAAAALEDPQQRARDVVRRGDHGLRLAFPARFDERRPRGQERVPKLGEQTTSVVAELTAEGLELPRWRRRAGVGRRASPRRWLAPWVLRWWTRRWRRRKGS